MNKAVCTLEKKPDKSESTNHEHCSLFIFLLPSYHSIGDERCASGTGPTRDAGWLIFHNPAG